MAELHDILLRPIITEKTTRLMDDENTYVFQVGDAANKVQVKRAIEALYGVQVASVRTLRMRGKVKRFGRHYGKRSNWKKAYITLAEGHALDLFES